MKEPLPRQSGSTDHNDMDIFVFLSYITEIQLFLLLRCSFHSLCMYAVCVYKYSLCLHLCMCKHLHIVIEDSYFGNTMLYISLNLCSQAASCPIHFVLISVALNFILFTLIVEIVANTVSVYCLKTA